jgi:hypothetical protein
MEAEHTTLLYYSETQWLSCSKPLHKVLEMKEEDFSQKLAYLVKKKLKLKLSLCCNKAPRHEDVLEEWKFSSTQCLALALDGGEWSALPPGKMPSVPIG